MSMSPESCAAALKEMSVIVDTELARSLEAYDGPALRMYGMLRYFLGYADENFMPSRTESGKRFRPSLALLIAEGYGVREKALAAAVAIELFHNFTLIHDDVEDHDELRRNRPTVWKLWGVNHAINSGDAQSLIAAQWALDAAEKAGTPKLARVLLDAFREVIEGQYLDFELATAPLNASHINEESYLRMIERKSGVLVRSAAEAAGIVAGKGEREIASLREYGNALGMAYQMGDDYRSVWTTQAVTGKDTHSDIREHKRTLPFLYAHADSAPVQRNRLGELYSIDRVLADGEIQEVLELLNATEARQKTENSIREYVGRAKTAAQGLSVPVETRGILEGIVDLLVPEGRTSGTGLIEHPSIALA
jgi:geranylgeranyl diphosphate synthase type I